MDCRNENTALICGVFVASLAGAYERKRAKIPPKPREIEVFDRETILAF